MGPNLPGTNGNHHRFSEQARRIEQINRAVSEMDGMIRENAANAEESASSFRRRGKAAVGYKPGDPHDARTSRSHAFAWEHA